MDDTERDYVGGKSCVHAVKHALLSRFTRRLLGLCSALCVYEMASLFQNDGICIFVYSCGKADEEK